VLKSGGGGGSSENQATGRQWLGSLFMLFNNASLKLL